MRLLALSCFLFSMTSFSHELGFPDGEYRGEGYWRDNSGQEGSYSAIVGLWNDEIWLNYSWEEAGERSEIAATLSIWGREDGGKTYDIGYNGLWVGEGTLENGVFTWWGNVEGSDVWETISYNEVGLHKEGHKTSGDEVISWSEWLYPWTEGNEGDSPTDQWEHGSDQSQDQTGGDEGQWEGGDETGVIGGGEGGVWPVPEVGGAFPGA